MKTKILILSAIFTTCLVSCEKNMQWLNPDDPEADLSKISAMCEEKHAECGYIEQEFDGKMRKIFCGECTQEGYECKAYNRCEDIDECADPTLNNCSENADCHNLDMKSEGKPFECVCKKNYSGDDCTPDTRTIECVDLPENAEWNSVSEITQTWNGKDWEPSNQGTFNEEASETECRFKCIDNYELNGTECLAETRKTDCDPKPANSVWNDNGAEGKLTQTWNGENWMPSSESTFNKTPGECVFKCATSFYWNNDNCEVAPTRDYGCTDLPANAQWNTAETITQTWDGDEWTPTNIGTYNETASTSECRFKCKGNYEWNNSTLACEGAKITSACTDLPENAVWNTATSITQTWSGEEWVPTTTGSYSETASTSECKYKCNNYSEWNGMECVSPCESSPCNNFANTDGSCTATGATTYTCGCNNGYFWNGSECKKQINICTGQTRCYNNNKTEEISCPTSETADFYGQDAWYASLDKCTQQSFTVQTVSNQKVVLDNNTGLIWQQRFPTDNYKWDAAVSYCNSLSYAGYSDWRLPTPQELLTIVDNSRYNPAIDTTYFPNTPSSYFWSSSTRSDITDYAWYVNFYYGNVSDYYKDYSYIYVRCVR